MAVNFNGGMKIGGVEYRHPLTSDEIRFILEIFKKCNFTGEEMENLIRLYPSAELLLIVIESESNDLKFKSALIISIFTGQKSL